MLSVSGTRFRLHKTVYQHKTVKACELMSVHFFSLQHFLSFVLPFRPDTYIAAYQRLTSVTDHSRKWHSII